MTRTHNLQVKSDLPQDEKLVVLRNMLRDWTWHDVCVGSAHSLQHHGVWFYGRVGLFLNRPCVAVCAHDLFVVLRYLNKGKLIYAKYDDLFGRLKPLDGTFKTGITLFEMDLPLLGLKPDDLVLQNKGD